MSDFEAGIGEDQGGGQKLKLETPYVFPDDSNPLQDTLNKLDALTKTPNSTIPEVDNVHFSADQVIDFIEEDCRNVQEGNGLTDNNIEGMMEHIRLCDDPQLPNAVSRLLELYDTWGFSTDLDELQPFAIALLRTLSVNNHGREAMQQVCSYMANHEDEYWNRNNGGPAFGIDEFMEELAWEGVSDGELLIEPLLSSSDSEMHKKVLRMLVDSVGFAHVITGVRAYVERVKGTPQVAAAESIGKWLLGVEDPNVPFHTSLDSFYANMDFEHFQLNVESQERDVNLLRQELAHVADMQGTVVDLGCGTGRLANALAADGMQSIVGIDSSQANLAKAKIADTSGKVEYMEADWTKTDLPDGSAKLVFSLGRSLPHAEDNATLHGIFNEARRVLVEGGVLYFDIPDPDTGMYLEARKRHLHNLRAMGIPIAREDDEALPTISTVVGSPDGVNYINRFMPPLDLVRAALHFKDFEVEQIGRYRLKPGDDAECVYFRATKKPETTAEELVARLKSRSLASSQQSADGE